MIFDNIISYDILKSLNSCLAKARQSGLEIVASTIQKVVDNIDTPMQLAIIGKVSSSKSTLVNAILGKEDVVGTGQMEETFNVSWLKYGRSDSDIKVQFKDGSYRFVPRRDWKSWSGQEQKTLKEKVQYLEVTYEHEILKKINIIDTPGLDSAKGTDSRNTIDFLTQIRPDAIIMVFTKGLAQSTMDVVKDFQGSKLNSFSISPLNAVGLLSKTDYFWKVSDRNVLPNMKAKEVIEENIYTLFPEVKQSFFTILPICSMLGLASKTIEDSDIELFKKLAKTSDTDLYEMLHSVNDFTDEFFVTDISIPERKYLHQKFGLYGIYEAIRLSRSQDITISSLKDLYGDVSGYKEFESILYSHFGQRSFLIKTQNASLMISSSCDSQRSVSRTKDSLLKIDEIQEEVLTCLMNIFEYKQLDFLSKIYDNSMNITDNIAIEEYKRVCGEYGSSVVEKLNLSGKPDIEEMESISSQRCKDWNAKYQLFYYKKETAELYRMLSASYDMLARDIKILGEKEREAKKVLKLTEEFFYGK